MASDSTTPIHFLHIGKTGGSAVKRALGPIAKRFNIVLHVHATRLADVPVGESVVFFVREPASRYVSGFNSRLRMGRPMLNVPWNAAEARAFGRFVTPNSLAEALSDEDDDLRRAAHAAMREVRHVNQRISYWLGDMAALENRRADILMIGQTERLAASFRKLKMSLGLPEAIVLPTDPFDAHVTPGGYERKLSEKASRNVQEWYAVDYELWRRILSGFGGLKAV